MDKVIVTVLLLIAGVICSLVVFNSVYPAINHGASAISSMSANLDDRIQSQIEVIETGTSGNEVYVWVKNVGASKIGAVDKSDVFFGLTGSADRIPYGSGTPRWEYTIENDTEWLPTATIKITITLTGSPSSGSYYVKVVLPNGIIDQYRFSI